MNILLTNSGRRTYIVEYLFELKDTYNKKINVYVSDTNLNVSSFWADKRARQLITPRVETNNKYYLEVLFQKCLSHKIDIIIPLMDFELHLLAKNKKKFKEIGTTIIVSDYNTVMNCLNKNKCYNFCESNNILVPKSWYKKKNISSNKKIVVKKLKGSGSKDLQIINRDYLASTYFDDSFLYQEYISGQEYGMDILNDLNGNFLHSCVKKKISMRSGETDRAEVIYSRKFTKIAKKISSIFKHIGNLDVDFIINSKNQAYFLDFNPRFGGGYPFTHLAGFNYLKAMLDSYKEKKTFFTKKKNIFFGLKGVKLYSCTK